MKIYKTAVAKFLERAERYYKNNRGLSEMVSQLEETIEFEKSWEGTDREKFAKSNMLKMTRILAVAEALKSGEYIEGIGGNAIAGLACHWTSNGLDIAKVRSFIEN